MPSYISNGGEWSPAKERVALKNVTNAVKELNGQTIQPGDDFIYEGPDRAALFELFQTKQEKFGIHFENDPELIGRVRQLGYKSVKEYAKAMGYDKAKAQEDFEKNASVVARHDLPRRIEEIKKLGGGNDTAGNNQDSYGGFGDAPNI